ncbi:MAG: amidohydrolase [Planctomycetaceae bacterium]|nr:amidohydrolase [Planctomycetaceae bacterium]
MPATAGTLAGLDQIHAEAIGWRRTLHQNPQTAFEETFASEFIAARLTEWGIPVHRGLATTGVVGTLEGTGTAGGELESIGLRADIDALDITEENDFEYRSQIPGKMHACGHDGHTTMLLAAAKYLSQNRNFGGRVQFIFQPAEENEAGGRVMVDEGLFDLFPVDAVFGMHNWPGLEIGEFAVAPGPMMASCDIFEITITGSGSHAAMPHHSVDPVVAAAHVVTALQTIASRNVNPLERVVLSVTQVHAGDTWNVIPGTAVLRGTVRTFSEEVQNMAEAGITRIATNVCAALGGSAKVWYDRRYPATVNTEQETEWAAETATRLAGADRVCRTPEPCMGSEDFAWMLKKRPGNYIWMGNGADSTVVHHPRYDFNDDAIPWGASYWVGLVESLLPASTK